MYYDTVKCVPPLPKFVRDSLWMFNCSVNKYRALCSYECKLHNVSVKRACTVNYAPPPLSIKDAHTARCQTREGQIEIRAECVSKLQVLL